jgi:hypothetical protein
MSVIIKSVWKHRLEEKIPYNDRDRDWSHVNVPRDPKDYQQTPEDLRAEKPSPLVSSKGACPKNTLSSCS